MSDVSTIIAAPVKLTTTAVTTIVDATNGKAVIRKLYITEMAGGTPNLSVELYDGTTSFYLMNTKPMTARSTVYYEDLPVNKGSKLRVTAGTANQIDVVACVEETNLAGPL